MNSFHLVFGNVDNRVWSDGTLRNFDFSGCNAMQFYDPEFQIINFVHCLVVADVLLNGVKAHCKLL
jgi:hypothetical protein